MKTESFELFNKGSRGKTIKNTGRNRNKQN
jgi:hypothetical protein